jgi:uncharacterized protein (DUF1697 family)
MPELRQLLEGAGFGDVRTYLQSGNVVLSSRFGPDRVARECEQRIASRFGFDITVLVRARSELAAIVKRNPLGKVAVDPKRYQVTFLASELESEVLRKLEAAAVAPERFVGVGRELYAWHPAGVARSSLWAQLGGKGLGVAATSRNWTTVTNLLALAG